jgi:hypothetical protein
MQASRTSSSLRKLRQTLLSLSTKCHTRTSVISRVELAKSGTQLEATEPHRQYERRNSGYKRGSNCCPERRTGIRIDYLGSAYQYRSRSRRQPMGENESTLGLTPNRLLDDLKTTFEGKHPDCRNHWHNNPCKMPDEVVRKLPSTIMVFATLDILYKSQVTFKDRLQAQDMKVGWMEVDGLHQHGPSQSGGEAIRHAKVD